MFGIEAEGKAIWKEEQAAANNRADKQQQIHALEVPWTVLRSKQDERHRHQHLLNEPQICVFFANLEFAPNLD
eukprot:SAG11_NODE_11653_length_746_cov_1.296754_1_plen_72_part_10